MTPASHVLIRQESTCRFTTFLQIFSLTTLSPSWSVKLRSHYPQRRRLRHLPDCYGPFGGKVVVLLGEFRQTCPVVQKGSKKDVIDASIKSSPLWPLFRTVHLPQLIRNAEDPDFATFINDIGDGTESSINLNVLLHAHSPEELIDFVFPREVLLDPMQCLTWSILAPTNDQIDHYNDKLVSRLPGESRTYFAANTIWESNETNIIPPASILDYNRSGLLSMLMDNSTPHYPEFEIDNMGWSYSHDKKAIRRTSLT